MGPTMHLATWMQLEPDACAPAPSGEPKVHDPHAVLARVGVTAPPTQLR
jgi:hypothetical protein